MATTKTGSRHLKQKALRMQVALWLLFYLFLLLYMLQKWDHPGFGFWSSTVATAFYAISVYSNSSFLIPRFYRPGKKAFYFIYSVLFLIALLFARVGIEYGFLYNLHPRLYELNSYHFSFDFITNLLAFLFGTLLRIAIDYIFLLRKQDEMQARQAATELALLKSQVQPHFLFNTLNNIYYLAYTKNEKTAEVIAKLSDIMRYFVDEAPKEKVALVTEITFLQNYIELEQIRMVNRAAITFDIVVPDTSMMIPPMLLIPFVENIFKHGIDKILDENIVHINLQIENGCLLFTTENAFITGGIKTAGGQGLANLRKRLSILFDDNFTLASTSDNNCYKTSLTFGI